MSLGRGGCHLRGAAVSVFQTLELLQDRSCLL